jgi:hypothetical protein
MILTHPVSTSCSKVYFHPNTDIRDSPYLNNYVKSRKSRSPAKIRVHHSHPVPHPAPVNISNYYSSPNGSFLNYASQVNTSQQSSPINVEWVSDFAAQLSSLIPSPNDVVSKFPLCNNIESTLLKFLSIPTVAEDVNEFY